MAWLSWFEFEQAPNTLLTTPVTSEQSVSRQWMPLVDADHIASTDKLRPVVQNRSLLFYTPCSGKAFANAGRMAGARKELQTLTNTPQLRYVVLDGHC